MDSSICSQTVIESDSAKIHVETLRLINLDLARLDYLDSTMIRKDSMIVNYARLDSLRIDRIEDYSIEVQELTDDNKKLSKRSKRNFKAGGLLGLLLGLATQLLF